MAQLRRGGSVRATSASTTSCWWSATGRVDRRGLGFVRSIRPATPGVYPSTGDPCRRSSRTGGGVLAWERRPRAAPDAGGDCSMRSRRYVTGSPRRRDFVTVVVPEEVQRVAPRVPRAAPELVRLKAGLLREPNVVVTDVPVVVAGGGRRRRRAAADPAADGHSGVRLGVNDATIRAVNYASPSRPPRRGRSTSTWIPRGAPPRAAVGREGDGDPARHLRGAVPRPHRPDARRGPPVHGARTPRDGGHPRAPGVEVAAVLLHNQNALFVKRLFLFEERCYRACRCSRCREPRRCRR